VFFHDVAALEQMLEKSESPKPLLVIAVVGSTYFGHNELVSKLIDLRQRYGFWLHLTGLNLASLITDDVQENLLVGLLEAAFNCSEKSA